MDRSSLCCGVPSGDTLQGLPYIIVELARPSGR